MVTLKDIATAANVSMITVSRVVNTPDNGRASVCAEFSSQEPCL